MLSTKTLTLALAAAFVFTMCATAAKAQEHPGYYRNPCLIDGQFDAHCPARLNAQRFLHMQDLLSGNQEVHRELMRQRIQQSLDKDRCQVILLPDNTVAYSEGCKPSN